MLFSWLFLFIDFFLENQNFGRKPYFSIWFLMIFSSGFSILYPGHEFCIFITCWPRDLLHFVWVCAAHNILMQFIYRDIWHIPKFFPREKMFDLQSDPSDMRPIMILWFSVSLPPTLPWAIEWECVACHLNHTVAPKKLWNQLFATCYNIKCHTLAFSYFLQKP